MQVPPPELTWWNARFGQEYGSLFWRVPAVRPTPQTLNPEGSQYVGIYARVPFFENCRFSSHAFAMSFKLFR